MYRLASVLLASAALGVASPAPTQAQAASVTTVTPIPSPSGDGLTITIINSQAVPITTSHYNDNALTPTSGATAPGTIAPSATAAFAAPPGWGGFVAIGDSPNQAEDNDSQIQGSLLVDESLGYVVADVGVSYVNGFSVPIVCSCNDEIVSGCNLDLFSLNQCPDGLLDANGACINPESNDSNATGPTEFFEPCQGAAVTYPKDRGFSFGACQSEQVTCCVGTSCPANPNQPVKSVGK